ncbi:MAG: type II secretion system protein [Synergistaceae bacterium]|nr:type II secretion system protein [Synergistaceae bacterium]
MKSIKRKGFTLVELLIVIVVIGILAAMMMLSSTEAVSSARANDIISNLRNLKTATLAWYADNIDKVNSNGEVLKADGKYGKFGQDDVVTIMDILPYLGNTGLEKGDKSLNSQQRGAKDSSGGLYALDYANNGKQWYVVYQMPNDNDTRVKEKLASRAKSIGLLYSQPGTANRGDYSASATGSRYPAMLVLDLEQ